VTPAPRDDRFTTVSRRRQSNRRRRRNGRGSRRAGAVAIVGAIVVLLIGSLVIAAGVIIGGLPDLGKAAAVQLGQNSVVWSGNYRLSVIPANENRTPLRWKDLGPHLRTATVAIEDKRYWQHGALDYEGIGRALWRDVTNGNYAEGGSTITQQLVRNLYIPDSARSKTIQRKLDEAWLAVQAEDRWTKAQILTMYLNTVFYGRNAYGAEAAAQTYFNRHAKQLTLPQAALLAGLPQAPSDYDPFKNPVLAKQRRNDVLRAMRQQHMISVATFNRALRAPLGLHAGILYSTVRQPYFVNYAKQVLIQKLPGGAEQLLKGGLSIETTINRRLQFAARRAIAGVLKTPGDPAAVIVSIQPRTGAIVAMQSSTNFAVQKFNLATQGARQAGSTFKAIALTAAVDDGIDPDRTYYLSTPSWDCNPPLCSTPWHVETYDHAGLGTVSLTNATLNSDNVVYAKLSTDLGAKREVEMAHLLGIRSPLKAVPSIALGSLEVTPLDLTSVYATLAAGGVYRPPRAVRRVRDSEDDLVGNFTEPDHKRVVPDGVASVVTGILAKNMVSGTGTRARLDDGRPEAGKTGTTSDYADAWFCGYTPDLATCVWVGYPKGRITMENIEGQGVVSGPTLPAQIWHDYMTTALENVPPSDFPPPLHPAELEPYTPVNSSGPGSSTPYVAPPAPPVSTTTTTSTTGSTTTGTTTTGTPATGTTTTGN
jgi:penicillin-binding protein 1A